MKKHLPSDRPRRILLNPVAAACAAMLSLLAQAAHAQDAAPAPAPADAASSPAKADATIVTVIGIRGSLETSLNLKRESHGVVDGIVAEDIGKFPDTNLAESMQRIAGVSIDRNASGEGSKVTVRGIGADYNMVLLNGRQMPTSDIGWETAGANGSRAFDFANLSSDSISALEVYKTARAETPTGGIGATINVKTARPLDLRVRVASIGIKGNFDASESRLPEPLRGNKVTPEISGIYSDTFADHTIGFSISGNYSKRDSGSNKAYTQNGWGLADAATGTDILNTGAGNVLTANPASNIVNKPTGLYATTRELRYSLTGMERERLNGQAVLQFAPTKDLRFTLDQTLAVNKLHSKNAEMSSWFNNAFSNVTEGPTTNPTTYGLGSSPPTTFTGGPVATPVIQTAIFDGAHDLAMDTGQYGQKTKLNSTGLNADWKIGDKAHVELDAHHSTSKTGPDSPYGTYSVMDLGLFNQGNATAYYGQKFPILSMPGTTFDDTKLLVTGTQFRNNLSEQTVDQFQAHGSYDLTQDDKLSLGLGFTRTKNRSASDNVQNNDWSGVGAPGSYAGINTSSYNLASFFTQIPGHDDPRLYPKFYMADFNSLRDRAIQNKMATTPGMTLAQAQAYFAAATDYSGGDDWRAREKSSALYGQWDHAFDTSIPMNVNAGLRYERTSVEASSQVISRTGTAWSSQNEVGLDQGPVTFGSKSGKYSYWLPSIDWDADLTSKLKVRASFGENIARPGWNTMLGGVSLNNPATTTGGRGATGDPALKPMLSKNLDLSAEYYYAKSSYVSLGAFYKKINDFVVQSAFASTFAGLNNPASGTYYNAAAAACGSNAPLCVRNYIFKNYGGQPGVTVTGPLTDAEIKGTITGDVAGAQPLSFNITTYTNGPGDKVKGLEFNFQHMLGDSGFGVQGNFTYVKAGLKYDNSNTNAQSALLGVSNSANLVGFYENDEWSVRAAYNWRGEFLAALTDGAGNNPVYTEAYGQADMSIGYKFGKHLTLTADLLNLTDGYIRQHGRTEDMLESAIQTGRRFVVGARYVF
jgi:TonB-dependent receptor